MSDLLLTQLLNGYRDAVARRVFWESNGRHGDGKLLAAKREEATARRLLRSSIQRRKGV